jgi:hypothetical protein
MDRPNGLSGGHVQNGDRGRSNHADNGVMRGERPVLEADRLLRAVKWEGGEKAWENRYPEAYPVIPQESARICTRQ